MLRIVLYSSLRLWLHNSGVRVLDLLAEVRILVLFHTLRGPSRRKIIKKHLTRPLERSVEIFPTLRKQELKSAAKDDDIEEGVYW